MRWGAYFGATASMPSALKADIAVASVENLILTREYGPGGG